MYLLTSNYDYKCKTIIYTKLNVECTSCVKISVYINMWIPMLKALQVRPSSDNEISLVEKLNMLGYRPRDYRKSMNLNTHNEDAIKSISCISNSPISTSNSSVLQIHLV